MPRPRLLQQLDEGLSQKLILISAPAGFGKSTLASSWLEHLQLPAAWLSLDEGDNDLARFFTYVIAALRTILPEVATDLWTLLQSSPLPHCHTLVTLLINELTARDEEFVLVFDDYHTIETESIDQALAYFVDYAPALVHVVVISRVDPNLPLARLRANGDLNEVRGADLHFTEAEAAQFLEQMPDLHLTAEEMALLDQRTEGWIAGLQMAALSLRKREPAEVARFIHDFRGSHRFIMDYLVDEVLQQQPPEVQTFLLYTSILDQFCVPLCEAILGDELAGSVRHLHSPATVPRTASTAQTLLTYLEQANLFITPLDDQRLWYRYHHLFADLLRQRLQQTYPDRVASLHLRASHWYEQAGLVDAAVRHALAAEAFSHAARLIEEAAPGLIQRSQLSKVLAWLEALPNEEMETRPLLALYYVRLLVINGDGQQVARQLKAIEAVFTEEHTEKSPEIEGHTAAMRAYLAREAGDFVSTITLFRQALTLLEKQEWPLWEMDIINLAIAHYLQGEFEQSVHLLDEMIAFGQTSQLTSSTLAAIYLKAQILRIQGSLQQARQLCEEGLELITQRNWLHFPAVGFLYVAYGGILREQNELTGAAEYLERGSRLGEEGGHPHIAIIGYVRMAWLRQAQGDISGSIEAIRTALQLAQHREVSHFWPVPSATCAQTRLWIAQGNFAAARQWAQQVAPHLANGASIFLHEVEYLTLARLEIAQGECPAAEPVLLKLQQQATADKREGSLIEILIVQALAFAAQGREDAALAALGQALDLAEPEGYIRLFLDEGAPMATLLRRAVSQNLHADYALHLLDVMGDAALVAAPVQALPEALSERELDVLRRIAAGYSNSEIAQELVVALSTVKRHISNIYGKLEVGSRTQAIAKAKELGLL